MPAFRSLATPRWSDTSWVFVDMRSNVAEVDVRNGKLQEIRSWKPGSDLLLGELHAAPGALIGGLFRARPDRAAVVLYEDGRSEELDLTGAAPAKP